MAIGLVGVGGFGVVGRIAGTVRDGVVGGITGGSVGEEVIVDVAIGVGGVSAWYPVPFVGTWVAGVVPLSLLPASF